MKRWVVFGQIFLTVFALIGCSSNQNDDIKYSILVVEGENNISGMFGEFTNNEYSVVEVEYLTSLKQAKEKYPEYEIQKAPAVYIFETGGGEMKKLKLKTYDVQEAIDFIKETRS